MPFQAGFYHSLHEGGKKDQKPVILIHGAGSSHLIWPAEIRRLVGHTVIALDLPGHGRSNGVGIQAVSEYTATIIEFLAATKIFQAAFVGHSLGGAIALQLALDFPQHVIGIGVLSAGASFNLPTELITYLSSASTASAGYQILQERLGCTASPPSIAAAGFKAMTSARSSVLYGDWLACSRFDLHNQVTRINTPAFVASGQDDRLTPPAQAHFLSTNLPLARLEMIRDAGHLLPFEQPAALAAGLQRFLDDLFAWHAQFPLPSEFPQENASAARPKNSSRPE